MQSFVFKINFIKSFYAKEESLRICIVNVSVNIEYNFSWYVQEILCSVKEFDIVQTFKKGIVYEKLLFTT